MTTMIREVYEAFLEAGASEEKAGAAAQALADYDSRFNQIDLNLSEIKSQLLLIKWMLGLVLLVTVVPVLKKIIIG